MVAISFAFNDLDFVIDPFQCSGMNWVVTVVKNPIAITAKHLGKLHHFRVIQGSGQSTPFINGLIGPCPGLIRPDVFDLIFLDQDGINDSVQS